MYEPSGSYRALLSSYEEPYSLLFAEATSSIGQIPANDDDLSLN